MARAEAKAAGVPMTGRASAPLSAEEIAASYKWTEPINTHNVADHYYAPALGSSRVARLSLARPAP